MNPDQYERWKDFAFRMARTCFGKCRRPNTNWIVEQVEGFFDLLEPDDIICFQNWEYSEHYPKGSRLYNKSCRCRCWHCSKVCISSDNERDADCPYHDCDGGWIFHYSRPSCVSTQVDDFLDNPANDWGLTCNSCDNNEGECYCDDIQEKYYEQWDDQWGSPIKCCLRAAIDFACEPTSGVMGFTAGDVRRMFPEGVPEWVFPKDETLGYFMSDKMNGTFESLPDTAMLLL